MSNIEQKRAELASRPKPADTAEPSGARVEKVDSGRGYMIHFHYYDTKPAPQAKQAGTPAAPQARVRTHQAAQAGQPTDDEIHATAQRMGISPEAARRALEESK